MKTLLAILSIGLAAAAVPACAEPTGASVRSVPPGQPGAGGSGGGGEAPPGETGDGGLPVDSGGPGDSASPGDSAALEDACGEVRAFGPEYDLLLSRWLAQDEAAPWPAGGLVAVGSSSIRRWEELAWRYSEHTVIQRGFGGAQLAEVALRVDELVLRHEPAAVVIFAGTNDVAHGLPAELVHGRLACLHQRIRESRPALPLLLIGITPTPARWDQWEVAAEVNAQARALAERDPLFTYVDVPTAFLATGSPPDAALFVEDGLHLSAEGYAVWDRVLRPEVDALGLPAPAASTTPPQAGDRILVDLGADDGVHGEATAVPDHLGQHWNNWHPLTGGSEVLPGERLAELRTDDGRPTSAELVITGGFFNNGREHGGLRWPSSDRLGGLAVGTATQDFFYALGDDQTGGLALRGLDPSASVSLRIFASRDHPDPRVTRFVLHGRDSASESLQTSGAGAGSDGGSANDGTVVSFTSVWPDAHGRLHLDLSNEAGAYAYISLLELTIDPR